MKEKFYSQEKLKFIVHRVYDTVKFILPKIEKYNLSYYEELEKSILKFLEKRSGSKYPTKFEIYLNLKEITENAEEDTEYLINAIVNMFIGRMIKDEPLDREQRLGIPSFLNEAKLNQMSIMGIVNKKILYPEFAVSLIDISGLEPELRIF